MFLLLEKVNCGVFVGGSWTCRRASFVSVRARRAFDWLQGFICVLKELQGVLQGITVLLCLWKGLWPSPGNICVFLKGLFGMPLGFICVFIVGRSVDCSRASLFCLWEALWLDLKGFIVCLAAALHFCVRGKGFGLLQGFTFVILKRSFACIHQAFIYFYFCEGL